MTPVRWCFQCGIEYADGVSDCVECGVELVDEVPSPEAGPTLQDQLAYELHEWAGESRRILDQLLTVSGIAHTWQGATLVVSEVDEVAVDLAVEEAESTGLPKLDPDGEQLAYEMAGWGADEQTAFSELLGRLAVAHEFDAQGDLVVMAADEDTVEAAIDAFQGAADDRPELEGLDANSLLTDLFVACDRLRRDARDNSGVENLVDLAPVLGGHRPPFGIDPGLWNSLGERSAELAVLLADGGVEHDDLRARAGELAETLRQIT
jgi:hypothetical protein